MPKRIGIDNQLTNYLRHSARIACPFDDCGTEIDPVDATIRDHVKSVHPDLLSKYDPAVLLSEFRRQKGRASPLNPNKRVQSPKSSARARVRSSSPSWRSRAHVSSKPDHDPEFKRSPTSGSSLWSLQRTGHPQKPARPRVPESVKSPAEAPFKKHETRPISQDQPVAEVKGIYAGLAMAESKCIEVDNAQSQKNDVKLSNEQWLALIALHRTLLHEHHDFFLASQHPAASPLLQRLATKYAMPARMWRHGIHSFLELLRHRLPSSLEHILTFIYLVYSIMALYETVPAFEATTIKCLSDLSRYRMAIDDDDIRDREIWTSTSRHWYSNASDKLSSNRRLYHHLAILARPNALQQLFDYTKSLCIPLPILSARESILTLFDPLLKIPSRAPKLASVEVGHIKRRRILKAPGPVSDTRTEWRIHGSAGGYRIDALADTGASINAMSLAEMKRLGLSFEPTTGAPRKVRLPGGTTCSSLGSTLFQFMFDGEHEIQKVRCTIVNSLKDGIILGYGFLQSSRTLAQGFFTKRIQVVVSAAKRMFTLCFVDHGEDENDLAARLYGYVNGERITAVPDSGSGIMAMSASCAKRLGLGVDRSRQIQIMFADGSTAFTMGTVSAAWEFFGATAGSSSFNYEWHVVDGLPVEAILDVNFIMCHDVFIKHQHAFVGLQDQPQGQRDVPEVFGIYKLPHGNLKLSSLADQYISDLCSTDPFSQNMVVRESARRHEIQRGIDALAGNEQAVQHIHEQQRIQVWNAIRYCKNSGGDWMCMRDEFIAGMGPRQPGQAAQPEVSHDQSVFVESHRLRFRRRLTRLRRRFG